MNTVATRSTLAAMLLAACLALAAACLAPALAQAQWKPTKPVTIIVPWAAGGATDQVTRLAASELETGLGQKIVIVNQPGGAGSIGTKAAMDAPNSRADPAPVLDVTAMVAAVSHFTRTWSAATLLRQAMKARENTPLETCPWAPSANVSRSASASSTSSTWSGSQTSSSSAPRTPPATSGTSKPSCRASASASNPRGGSALTWKPSPLH